MITLGQLIENYMGALILKCNLSIRVVSSTEVYLSNPNCIIRFLYSEGFLLCDLIDPVEKERAESRKRPDGFPVGFPVYSAFTTWKLLYKDDKTDYSIKGKDLPGQVEITARLLSERLTNVINGDFSWRN